MNVGGAMAAAAFGFELLLLQRTCMAGMAVDRGMLALERESGVRQMIEGGDTPDLVRVTIATLRPEAP